jgi:hypothetical protein
MFLAGFEEEMIAQVTDLSIENIRELRNAE